MVNFSWGGSYNAAAGGADSITLATANLPAHTHTGTTSSNGSHTHSYYNYKAISSPTKTYFGNGSVSNGIYNELSSGVLLSAGAHTHTFTTSSVGSGTAFDNRPAYATIVICEKD